MGNHGISIVGGLVALTALTVGAGSYEPNWESLDRRPVAQWWVDAKFGIFVHWGPYAVPAYAPTSSDCINECYSEWYCGRVLRNEKNFADYHKARYGRAPYANFAAQFTAENFDPKAWAELFRKAGAKYAVLTSKHHDGYALWPSPESAYYNSVVVGSGRDLAGEFTAAMKSAGLRSGFYYSLLEYANPFYPKNFLNNAQSQRWSMSEWSRRVNLPQMKELVVGYRPDILWTDGEWDFSDKEELSEEFLAWLYNESPVKDDVVVNDRWGKDCRGRHGGHYTTEYFDEGGDASGISDEHPWEECRGIGRSFGFNRFENAEDYATREKCIELLVSCVARGGNLLLNVGPTADGRIPVIMQDRLLAIGRWLAVNGEAIYGTRRWPRSSSLPKEKGVYYTQKGEAVYAIVFGERTGEVMLRGLGDRTAVRLLGSPRDVSFRTKGEDLVVDVPAGAIPGTTAYAFELRREK